MTELLTQQLLQFQRRCHYRHQQKQHGFSRGGYFPLFIQKQTKMDQKMFAAVACAATKLVFFFRFADEYLMMKGTFNTFVCPPQHLMTCYAR